MRFRHKLAPKTSVDLVPMIDVSINILVFFMVSMTFNMTPAINLELPQSTSAEVTPVTTLTLTVKDQNQIWLNKEEFTLESLNERLHGYTAADREKIQSVMLQGDASVAYSVMVKVLDVLRNNGFSAVSLKTEDPGALK